MAKILAGKNVIAALDEETIIRVGKLREKGVIPGLAIIRIGENEGDVSYQRGANKKAEALGINVKNINLHEDVSQKELLEVIHKLNDDERCHGVLLLRPLPNHIDDDEIRNALSPEKDMDGITDVSMAGVFAGKDDGYPSCTPAGCIRILDYYGYNIEGRRVTIIGRSLVVGRPLALMLIDRNATVTVCHSRTPKEDVINYCQNSDIIVVTAGVPKMLTSEYFCGKNDEISSDRQSKMEKPIIIDVGIHMDDDGHLCGDVDFESVEPFVEAITPVPGGVGMTTSSILMKHVVASARKVSQKKENNF